MQFITFLVALFMAASFVSAAPGSHGLETYEIMDKMVAKLIEEQQQNTGKKLDDPDKVQCGWVQSSAPIPPFPLTTFPQWSDCNLISYGGVAFQVWEGCTCEFYFIPCDVSHPLIKVVGPQEGEIPNDRAYGYNCVAGPDVRPPRAV